MTVSLTNCLDLENGGKQEESQTKMIRFILIAASLFTFLLITLLILVLLGVMIHFTNQIQQQKNAPAVKIIKIRESSTGNDMSNEENSPVYETLLSAETSKAVIVQAKTKLKLDVPKALESQRKEKEVKKGGEVELRCFFSAEMTCAWLRRGEHIDIKGRYSYTGSGNGVGKDCSIKIQPAKSIDSGKWECSSIADANSQGTILPPIQLTVS